MAVPDGASPVPGPVPSTGRVQSTQASRPHKVRATISATLAEEQTTSQREARPLAQGYTASECQGQDSNERLPCSKAHALYQRFSISTLLAFGPNNSLM